VFASKAMGDGVAIVPDDGVIYAPTDATVVMAYPTGHAIGLQTDEGIEMLLHIGINTVELNGKGFEILVKSGQKVRQGDKLIEFDVETIRQAGYDATVMQLVTNMKESAQIHLEDKETVDEKDEIMKLEWA
jgi:PTS system beta-glucosides-specific IIC component